MRGNSSDLFGETNDGTPYKYKPRTKAAHTPDHRQGEGEGKVCKRCKEWRRYEEYNWCPSSGRFYRHSTCQKCLSKDHKVWAKTEAGRKHRKAAGLRMRYKMPLEQYEAMFKAQKGACAICGTTKMAIDKRTKMPRDLSVDHDHKTGDVRALLCHSCNIGLGGFRDDIKTLHAAIAYLKRFAVSP